MDFTPPTFDDLFEATGRCYCSSCRQHFTQDETVLARYCRKCRKRYTHGKFDDGKDTCPTCECTRTEQVSNDACPKCLGPVSWIYNARK